MKQKRSKLLQFVWGNITMALDYLASTDIWDGVIWISISGSSL